MFLLLRENGRGIARTRPKNQRKPILLDFSVVTKNEYGITQTHAKTPLIRWSSRFRTNIARAFACVFTMSSHAFSQYRRVRNGITRERARNVFRETRCAYQVSWKMLRARLRVIPLRARRYCENARDDIVKTHANARAIFVRNRLDHQIRNVFACVCVVPYLFFVTIEKSSKIGFY